MHGTDFANYKRNTVERRVMRRMVLHKVQSLREYAQLLKGNRNEVDALYQDILIGVTRSPKDARARTRCASGHRAARRARRRTRFFPNPDASEALKETVFPATAAAPARRVLVVDDNADSGSSLRTVLRMDGHEVELVQDAAGALAAARVMRPDVVLLDIGLPDMDGYEVARRLRADGLPRDALIAATTGYGRAQDREKSRRAGIDAHLTKPVDMEQLTALLARGRRAPKG